MLKNGIFILLALGAVAVTPAAGAAERTVSGTATYRERMALPPTVRFEAVILDAARADAPAAVLARTVIDNPGQPPIRFALAYDDAKLDPRARYLVRASVTVDGTLWFTTDTVTPLPTGGEARVNLLLHRVSSPKTRRGEAPARGSAARSAISRTPRPSRFAAAERSCPSPRRAATESLKRPTPPSAPGPPSRSMSRSRAPSSRARAWRGRASARSRSSRSASSVFTSAQN